MKISKNIALALAALSLLAVSSTASASNAGAMASGLLGQIDEWADLILAIIFVAGLGTGFAGLMKLKAHTENAQQVPLKQPLIYLAVAAMLIAFPAYLKMGKSTFFGDGAEGTKIEEGSYGNI